MYTKFFLLFISVVLFFVFNVWSVLKTKYGEWMSLSAFTKIDIVEEATNFNDDFPPHGYETYTKILLAAVVATFVTLVALWTFNKRTGRKYMSPALDKINANDNVEIIWECSDEADENESKSVDSQKDRDNDIDIKTLLEMHKQLISQDTSLYGSLCDRIADMEQSLFTVKDQVEKLNEGYRSLCQIQDAPIMSSISSSRIVDLKDILKDVSWHKTDNREETESEDKDFILSSQEIVQSINSTGDNKVVLNSADSPIPKSVLSRDNNPACETPFNEEEYLRNNSKLRFSGASHIRNKTKRAKLPRKPGTICILDDKVSLQEQKSTAELKSGESCVEYVQTKQQTHSRQTRRRF